LAKDWTDKSMIKLYNAHYKVVAMGLRVEQDTWRHVGPVDTRVLTQVEWRVFHGHCVEKHGKTMP
jgi:hypothetical protein